MGRVVLHGGTHSVKLATHLKTTRFPFSKWEPRNGKLKDYTHSPCDTVSRGYLLQNIMSTTFSITYKLLLYMSPLTIH